MIRVPSIGNSLQVAEPDLVLRAAIAADPGAGDVVELTAGELGLIAWSGTRAHVENVAQQLIRAEAGEVDYRAIRVEGQLVTKGAIDYEEHPGAGAIFQVATRPDLEGLGLATRLIGALEACAVHRGLHVVQLGVEPDNERARRLYESLGYRAVGTSQASWEQELVDGTRRLYTTTLIEMTKEI